MSYTWNDALIQYYDTKYSTEEHADDYYSDITEEYEKYEYEGDE
jgi:hypothetical protein